MPQKWVCGCGQSIPLNLSFCGNCGLRWDKTVKQGKDAQQKVKAKKGETPKAIPQESNVGRAPEFVLPSLGSALSALPHSSVSAAAQDPAQPAQPKTLSAAFHQRGNRIAKIQSRITKLQAGISDVQERWPVYVHELQQQIQQKHQLCTEFHRNAIAEISMLQQELHMLQNSKVEVGHVQPSVAPKPAVVQHPGLQSDATVIQTVQATLEFLTTAGLLNSQPYLPQVPQDMDVDVPQVPKETAAQSMPSSSPPCEYPLMHPMLPVQNTPPVQVGSCQHMPTQVQMPSMTPVPQPAITVVPTTQDRQDHHSSLEPPMLDVPPGNWAWPPNAPVLSAPGMTPDQDHYPNPLYKPKAVQAVSVQSVLPEDSVQPVQTIQHAVQEAAAGLRAMHSIPADLPLPQQLQAQLDNFAEQQALCQQRIQDFLHQAKGPPKMQQAAQISAEESAAHQSATELPGTPKTPGQNMTPSRQADAMSIHSSPAKGAGHQVDSPPQQRVPKVPKALDGHVHIQPAMMQAQTTAIPLSPSNSHHSSEPMVPTEIAESEWNGPNAAAANLTQLE